MQARLAWLHTALLLCALLVLASPQPAAAQSYPDKSVKLVVPFAAGGPADALGRILGEKLSQRWGQTVVIENRAGPRQRRGCRGGARGHDGYTLLLNARAM